MSYMTNGHESTTASANHELSYCRLFGKGVNEQRAVIGLNDKITPIGCPASREACRYQLHAIELDLELF
jgi:hypothetical protein